MHNFKGTFTTHLNKEICILATITSRDLHILKHKKNTVLTPNSTTVENIIPPVSLKSR